MAHQSGFDGTISITTGPSGLVSSGPLQSWTVRQNRGCFEAFGKGESWVTTFGTVKRWSAEVTALVSDAAVVGDFGLNSIVSPTTGLVFKINAADTLAGNGHIENCVIEDPLDGPVVARLSIRGNGTLTPAAA